MTVFDSFDRRDASRHSMTAFESFDSRFARGVGMTANDSNDSPRFQKNANERK